MTPQCFFDERSKYVNGNQIIASLWNYYISITFGRLNKLQMHGLDKFIIMMKYLLKRAAPFFQVATDNTHQAVVPVGIYKGNHVYKGAEGSLRQQSLDQGR